MTPLEDNRQAFAEDFRLGEWIVCPARNEVTKADTGDKLRVEHKVMRLLEYLAANASRDLSRDEIIAAVWGDGVHNDEVLTVAISSLRKALNDNPKAPRYVKTLPRYGYRMLEAGEAIETPLRDVRGARTPGIWRRLEERLGLRWLMVGGLLAFLLFVILVQVIVELVYVLKG